MKALREGIAVMDQEIRLSDFRLRNRRVTAISTMHPLFLAQNLTQIICMLEGLHRMEADWVMGSYARNTAVSIWCQLSEYARTRIAGTLIDLMGLDGDWYSCIDEAAGQRSEKMFYNEPDSSDRNGLLVYAMKGSLLCSICYISDDDAAYEARGFVTGIDKSSVRIRRESEEEEIVIDRNNILEIEVATQLR